jgi:hypothetical protein
LGVAGEDGDQGEDAWTVKSATDAQQMSMPARDRDVQSLRTWRLSQRADLPDSWRSLRNRE